MAREHTQVVVVDGDQAELSQIERILLGAGVPASGISSRSRADFHRADRSPDLVFIPVGIPRTPSQTVVADLVAEARHAHPLSAIIALLRSDTNDGVSARVVRACFEAGAAEVIEAGMLARGGHEVARAVESSLEVASLRRTLRDTDDTLCLALAEVEVLESQIHEIYDTLGSGLNASVAEVMTRLGEVRDGHIGPLESEPAEYLSIAIDSGWQLGRLTRDLMLVRRLSAGEVEFRSESVDVDATFRQAVEIFEERAARADVKLVLEECGLAVRGDSIRLLQVVSHLVDNALRCTPEAGTVRLGALLDRHGHVVCTVRDDGRGIAHVDLPRAFDRLEKCGLEDPASEPGAGLGLAICRGIIEALGGEIELASTAGVGTLVTFWLPQAEVVGVASSSTR